MKINQKPEVRRRLKKHFFWKREIIRCKNPAYFYNKYIRIMGYRVKKLTNTQYGKIVNSYKVSLMTNRFRQKRFESQHQEAMYNLMNYITFKNDK